MGNHFSLKSSDWCHLKKDLKPYLYSNYKKNQPVHLHTLIRVLTFPFYGTPGSTYCLPDMGRLCSACMNLYKESFDIKFIRQDPKRGRKGMASQASPVCFWLSLINFVLRTVIPELTSKHQLI